MPSEAELSAAIEEASRRLGVSSQTRESPEPGGGPERWIRPAWIVIGLLVAGIVAALVLRGADVRGQAPHVVEADLRWAVAQVVEHVERQRLLRGRIPEASELRVLLGEAVTYSVRDGGYRVVGRRDEVRVEYDGSVPLEEWRQRVLHPPGSGRR